MAAGMTNSAVLFVELQARGYAGRDSILRRWLARNRPLKRGAEPVVRFETDSLPGAITFLFVVWVVVLPVVIPWRFLVQSR